VMTQSIQKFLAVTEKRRARQIAYNKEHNITPRSVVRAVEESLAVQEEQREAATGLLRETKTDLDVTETIRELEGEMLKAAEDLQFEKAALLRDQIKELKRMASGEPPAEQTKTVRYRKTCRRKAR